MLQLVKKKKKKKAGYLGETRPINPALIGILKQSENLMENF